MRRRSSSTGWRARKRWKSIRAATARSRCGTMSMSHSSIATSFPRPARPISTPRKASGWCRDGARPREKQGMRSRATDGAQISGTGSGKRPRRGHIDMKDVRAWLAKCVLVALLSLLHAPQLVAQSAGWQKIWDETLAAARKEGKVVVVGSPDPVFRNEIIPTFRSKFGIEIEAIFGSSGPLAERARMERASGIRYLDVFMPGPSTAMYNLEAEHLLDPIKPLLLLPEVADHSKWKLGQPHFIDAGKQNVLMLFRNVESFLFVNEAYVKPGELKTLDDLLNPKWAGKIETQDPLGSGTASDLSAYFYTEKGPDFVRKLFVDQKPVIREDRRQLMDSLARGT